MPNIKAALLDAAQRRELVLFAGAGMSRQAVGLTGLDLRDRLGDEIRRDFPNYDVQARTLEDVCDEYAALNDRPTLLDRLAALIPHDAQPQPSHLAAVRTFRFVVTTNWDMLFERASIAFGTRYQVLSSDADAPMFNYDQQNLLKIHGSVDRPVSLVATTEDYEAYPDTHANLLSRMAELLQSNTVLFVGYGLRDEHVRRLLSRIRRANQQWTRRAYAVGFYDEVRTRLLATRHIEAVHADADDFLTRLAEEVAP